MDAASSSGALSTYKRPCGEIDKTNAMIAASLPAGLRRKGPLGKYFAFAKIDGPPERKLVGRWRLVMVHGAPDARTPKQIDCGTARKRRALAVVHVCPASFDSIYFT